MKKAVSTDKAPKALGSYSQGIISGNLVFTSGQIAIDPVTGNFEGGTIEQQSHRTFKNIAAILEAAGSDLDKSIKVTMYLKDMNDFAKVNEIYSDYFRGTYPARAAVEVSRLPRDAAIEIEVVAYI
jgi:2-iminobutanoate/2-iminopropanoate deaminase